jgi:RS4NT (NUC023) domain.
MGRKGNKRHMKSLNSPAYYAISKKTQQIYNKANMLENTAKNDQSRCFYL